MYIEKVQLMKNWGKNRSVAFIILFSVYIYIYIYVMLCYVHFIILILFKCLFKLLCCSKLHSCICSLPICFANKLIECVCVCVCGVFVCV